MIMIPADVVRPPFENGKVCYANLRISEDPKNRWRTILINVPVPVEMLGQPVELVIPKHYFRTYEEEKLNKAVWFTSTLLDNSLTVVTGIKHKRETDEHRMGFYIKFYKKKWINKETGEEQWTEHAIEEWYEPLFAGDWCTYCGWLNKPGERQGFDCGYCGAN